MASTRALSPAGDMSTPTSPQLTPRSKVKAMLATVDDGASDDESTGPIDTKALFTALDKNKLKLNSTRAVQGDSTEEDDDEDDEIVRPRGRLAARMHTTFTEGEPVSKRPSNASKSAQQDVTHSGPEHINAIRETPVEGHEEDDDIIAPPRRRVARHNRESTPETTVRADQQSPSLFVSPEPQNPTLLNHNSVDYDSDDNDVPIDLSKNARFKALIEKKRRERLDREAEEERKRIERAQLMGGEIPAESDEDDVSDISDDDGGRKLTQDISRPTRKASKKALEEMNRETQRLSRSLQLAHEVKTKKKISKASLFQRFNFRTEGSTTETQNKPTSSSRPTTPGSVHQTDVELENSRTPPSSPPTALKGVSDRPVATMLTSENNLEGGKGGLLNLEDALAQTRPSDKAQGKVIAVATAVSENMQPTIKKPLRQVRVKVPPVQTNSVVTGSDDELEITNSTRKDKLDTVFARIPEKKTQETTGMKILRNLAHLSSPPKEPTRARNAKPSMTLGELQMSLQQRAKVQAKLERERRLELLRSKGIVVQSAEEREREREQVEDIVAKARQEVEEIMLREREDAKRVRKEKQQNGELDPLAWDDSDDDSFQDDEDEEVEEVELSGSEEEGEQDHADDDEVVGVSEDEEAGDGEERVMNNPMLMDEAEEGQSEGFSDEDIEEMKRSAPLQSRRPKKHVQIISDDEDEDEDDDNVDVDVKATPKPKSRFPRSPSAPGSRSPKPPTSVLRSATKTFIPGLPIAAAAPAGLGLTQIFAGTMDDSQAGSINGSPQEFMPSIDQFPDSQFSATAGQSQNNDMISDSQPTQTAVSQGRESQTQGLQLHYSQSQAHGFDSLIQADATQMSEFLEPTQDGGFQYLTPLKQRFIDPPQSTVGTLLLTGTPDEAATQNSPLRRKRGKLLRRVDLPGTSSTLPSAEVPESSNRVSTVEVHRLSRETAASSDAFRLMEKAAIREKRLKRKFDKKKSKATEMIEEQAAESEDEYAGLGGADGEDSSDEDDELTKEMIDDTGNNNGDEAKLAGLFA
jgi:mediator of replication checkpoint protein 1